jgi:hypothetical protein
MDFIEEICVKHGNCGDKFESNHKQVLAFIYNHIHFLLQLTIHHPQFASNFRIPTKIRPIPRNQPNVSTVTI